MDIYVPRDMQRIQASSSESDDKQLKLSNDYEKSISDVKQLQAENNDMIAKMEDLREEKVSLEHQLGEMKILTSKLQEQLESKGKSNEELKKHENYIQSLSQSLVQTDGWIPSEEEEPGSDKLSYDMSISGGRADNISELLEMKMSRLDTLTERLMSSNVFRRKESQDKVMTML